MSKNDSHIGERLGPLAALNNATYGKFHRKIAMVGSLGAFTDLYVIQGLGASTFSIIPNFLVSKANFSLTASLLFFGAIFGVFSMGFLVDKIGRRAMLISTLSITAVLGLVSAIVTTVPELYAVRFLLGFVTGADYPAAMTLVSEFMPAASRGKGLTYVWVGFTLGGIVAWIVGYLLFITMGATAIEWRIMLGSTAIPALVGAVLRVTIPESPRWNIEKKRYKQAADAIQFASGKSFSDDELGTARAALFDVPKDALRKHYMKYIVVMLPMFAAVLCFNMVPGALSTLNPVILSALGIDKGFTLLYSALFIGIQAVAVFMVSGTIENVGRTRWMLIGGTLEAVFGFLVIGVYHVPIALLVVMLALSFAAFIAIPVMRNLGSELFPTEFRGFASGVVMTGDRLSSAIGLLLTPLLFAGNDVSRLFLFYGLLGIIGVLVAYFPVMRKYRIERVSLEDIQEQILGLDNA